MRWDGALRASAASLAVVASLVTWSEIPLHARLGDVLARGKGVAGDSESEGIPRQNASLTNSKRIEAAQRGKVAVLAEAQCLHVTLRRRSDRHRQEGRANCLGISSRLPLCYRASKGNEMSVQKSVEAVVSGR